MEYIATFTVTQYDYLLGCDMTFECNQYTDHQEAEILIDSIQGIHWHSITFELRGE